ncbi:MAG: DUF3276 family protein [Treponema sp.]|nr:DUF3276 family protein [Treponema sp.]
MGVRGEIFSTRMILPNRTYFLNVKENRMGDLYLNIVESKNKETGGFERQSVIVFADDLPAFLGEFDKSLKALEKARREQKRGTGKHREEPEKSSGKLSGRAGQGRTGRDFHERSGRAGQERTGRDTYGRSGPAGHRRTDGGLPGRAGPPGYSGQGRSGPHGSSGQGRSGGKRVVVKKRNRD